MKRTFAFGAAASLGTWPVQEDGFFADPAGGVFALADGFGGRGAGDMAAKAALLAVRAARGEKKGLEGQRRVFAKVHAELTEKNKTASAKGGCSLLWVELREGMAEASQCGACTLLLVREGKVLPILLPQAAPREEFQPLFPDQALGVGEDPRVESRAFSWKSGDILLFHSSGMEHPDWLSSLASHMAGGDLSALATQLVEGEGLAGEGWNRTVLLVELF
jgi:serine/threonine protein phosphatase PrpC